MDKPYLWTWSLHLFRYPSSWRNVSLSHPQVWLWSWRSMQTNYPLRWQKKHWFLMDLKTRSQWRPDQASWLKFGSPSRDFADWHPIPRLGCERGTRFLSYFFCRASPVLLVFVSELFFISRIWTCLFHRSYTVHIKSQVWSWGRSARGSFEASHRTS